MPRCRRRSARVLPADVPSGKPATERPSGRGAWHQAGRPGTSPLYALVAGVLILALVGFARSASSQGLVDPDRNGRIEAVEVALVNPSDDPATNSRIEDRVRRELGAFPFDRYSPERVAVALARLTRSRDIARITHVADGGPTGGVVLRISVVLARGDGPAVPRGALTAGGRSDLPALYEAGGTSLRVKLESLGMAYANGDAWYGRPDLMLAGNPFAKGQPAGAGRSGWVEGFVHGGVYGITPITPALHLYGGLSAIASGSYGQELFTDRTRSHFAVEDAFIGLVGGRTSAVGDRFVYNVSAGRQRFGIGDGMLVVNTSSNGLERAALQSNPRWAGDRVVLARMAYNTLRAEVFDIDPDEIPEVDSRTRLQGVNLEGLAWSRLSVGLTGLRVPKSTFAYYTPTEVLGREGLRVLDLRLRWQPEPVGRPGPFVAAEVARQTHRDFAMRAWAGTAEAGYVFARSPWTPTASYRFARFSGDDPTTSRFERWDPCCPEETGRPGCRASTTSRSSRTRTWSRTGSSCGCARWNAWSSCRSSGSSGPTRPRTSAAIPRCPRSARRASEARST